MYIYIIAPVPQHANTDQQNVKRHRRPTQANAGGIEAFEAPIAISNVAHIDPESGAATRVSIVEKDGKKQRVAKASGKVIG